MRCLNVCHGILDTYIPTQFHMLEVEKCQRISFDVEINNNKNLPNYLLCLFIIEQLHSSCSLHNFITVSRYTTSLGEHCNSRNFKEWPCVSCNVALRPHHCLLCLLLLCLSGSAVSSVRHVRLHQNLISMNLHLYKLEKGHHISVYWWKNTLICTHLGILSFPSASFIVVLWFSDAICVLDGFLWKSLIVDFLFSKKLPSE